MLPELEPPFLLYLHYLDPHAPYRPPAGWKRRFTAEPGASGQRKLPRWLRDGEASRLAAWLYRGARRPPHDEADLRHLVDLYDEEIAHFDARLGELLAGLTAAGHAESTIVVVTSDHGEELLDHGHLGHCRALAWDTVLRVPLVVRWPGGPRGVTRRAPVSTLDLFPTLLDLAGLPVPPGLSGRSLRPTLETDRAVRRHRFAAQGPTRVVADGRFKLVHDLATGASALYDLAADPAERRDVAALHPALVAEWRAAVLRAVAREHADAGAAVREAADVEAQLEAVGYL
jgi:arylsulfatase A-like enzyme